jgi:hypothetical protein
MTTGYLIIFILITLTMVSESSFIYKNIAIFGKRSLFDKRIEKKFVDISGILLRKSKVQQTFKGDNIRKITQIKVVSNSIFSKNIKVKIIEGGIGYTHVTLEFTSPRSKGIDVVVKIYGRPPHFI